MTPAEKLAGLADRAWTIRLREPYFRLRAGLPVEQLRSNTLEELERDARDYGLIAAEARTLEARLLSKRDRLTRGFLVHAADEAASAVQRWWEQFPITPYASSGLWLYLQQIFSAFEFENPADGERYLSLLADLARSLRATADRLGRQAERGWRIPRPALPGSRLTLERIRDYAAAALKPDTSRTAALPADFAGRVATRVGEIARAFDELLATVGADYEQAADESVGLCHFRGGEAAYRRAIHNELTLDVDPEWLHATGLTEVGRITAAMADLRAKQGWEGDEGAFHQALRTAPRALAKSAEDIERTYLGHLARMRARLPDYFSVLPKADFGVARLAPELEAGMSYGYYQPPMAAGGPGLYHYNGSGLDTRMQLNAAALIFHELAPGHHFHLARQAENTALPAIRREAVGLTVFNEGWAEYASSLGLEMGLYEEPYDHYGRLIHERFIAQRLVVDTGLNAFGWSLQRARDYMKSQTLESDVQIASETLRYSTDLPAQALAYDFGFNQFWKLRREAQREPQFDIRRFHEAILAEGALPFPLLEESPLGTAADEGTRA